MSERDGGEAAQTQPAEATNPAERPTLRIVSPDATPEEIAAIVAVFAAMGGGAPAPRRPRSAWAHPERQARRTLPHGVGGWRASGLPR